MPTPTKPAKILEMEKRSHRTKKELAQRKRAEAELLTGSPLREKPEVRGNPAAHKEFARVRRLLAAIGKNDDLYGETINRYCTLAAECGELQERRGRTSRQLCDAQERADRFWEEGDAIAWRDAAALADSQQKAMDAIDRQLQAKRKMMMDIEKENLMTIASALRSVPKKAEKKNALKEALGV